jgi:PilZ domain
LENNARKIRGSFPGLLFCAAWPKWSLMADKRVEARLRSRGELRIFTEDGEPLDAKVLDISPSGIGLEAAIGLESGTVVRLHCHGAVVGEGIVRHCRASGQRFLVGVALLP